MTISRLVSVLGVVLLFCFTPTHAKKFSVDSPCYYLEGKDDLMQFHLAVCNGESKNVKKFIKKGINPNVMTTLYLQYSDRKVSYKFNALHTALLEYRAGSPDAQKYKQIIQLLVDGGINVEIPFRKDRPINIVNDKEISAILIKGGAKATPLIVAGDEGEYRNFTGKIVVSGKLFLNPRANNQTGELCMVVDEKTFHMIPRVQDGRTAWFCIKNHDKALAMLKIKKEKTEELCFSGFAKIEVSNYRQYRAESEGCDYADLVKVLEMKNYSYKECPQE